jgi:large repetitive protein
LEENFDRFNLAIHKEKEMADFRRWIIALAVLALFAGLASAQTGGSGGPNFTCNANTSNTPTIRQEGITEQIGDIVITCVGGQVTDGVAGPQVNITVALTSQITTRLVSTDAVSQAMLLIDDPTTGNGPVANFGSNATFVPCGNSHPSGTFSGGCPAFGYHVISGPAPNNVYVIQSAAGSPTGPTTQAPNIYQGVVNGSNVTFFGIPIVAPGSNGQRVYRITGIRTNASTFSNGAAVQAFVQTSNPSALPISNAQPIVAFVQASLTTSAVPAVGFAQCVTQTLAPGPILTYSEANNFASAFKTRTDPAVPGQTAGLEGQSSTSVQTVPGTIYRSESGFTPPTTIQSTTATATSLLGSSIGLTDFGTRFHAVFTNLPAGANVFVSTVNVAVTNGVATGPIAKPANFTTQPYTSYAIMVASDNAPEVTSANPPAGTATVNGIPLVQISTTGSTTATASWEVISTQPTAIDTFQFAVYISYTANPGANSPAVGTASVNLWYAPTSTVITATAGDPIPRFLDASKAANAFSIAACQTVLLFPYVANVAGFDTGLAIANTSTDPFGTVPQNGTCKLNWYGTAAPAVTTTPNVPTATVYANTTSTLAPGFFGYMIAQCAFQYAHGFAFVSDVGARNLAMGYLALIIPDPSIRNGARPPTSSPDAPTTTGEQLGN